tara:strand:- start:2909 stop:3121 length:213 start_codon:yes stop_codon:yes gene_type:complete
MFSWWNRNKEQELFKLLNEWEISMYAQNSFLVKIPKQIIEEEKDRLRYKLDMDTYLNQIYLQLSYFLKMI